MYKKMFLFLGAVFAFSVLFCESAFAIHADGVWDFGAVGPAQNGKISFDFPAGGGEVEGSFSGSGYATDVKMEGIFIGNFTGGWDGTFSGTFSGGVSYTWTNPQTGASEPADAPLSGSWTASSTKDGTMKVFLSASNSPSSNMVATFSPDEFEVELGLSEYEKAGGLMDSGIKAEGIAKIFGDMAYVVVDGKTYEIPNITDHKDDFVVQSGMTFGVEHKNGSLTLKIDDEHEVFMSGVGEITVLKVEDIDKSKWKEIVGQQPAGTLINMKRGTVVVKYKTGSKEGYYVPGTVDDAYEYERGIGSYERQVDNPEDTTKMNYIVFSTKDSDLDPVIDPEDFTPGNISGLRDTGYKTPYLPSEFDPDPDSSQEEDDGSFWGLLFGNHSEVKYDFDGENVDVEVIEGNVEVFDTDFKGNMTKVTDIKTGEKYSVNLADYYSQKQGGGGEQNVIVDGGVGRSSNKLYLYGGIGSGVLILLGVVVFLIKRK